MFLVFILLGKISLIAGVLDHLKPIGPKMEDHSFGPIDCVYLINLDQRPEKYEHSINELSPYGIHPFRFSAVNGWEDLTLEMINDLGVKYEEGMDHGFLATRYPLDGAKRQRESILETIDKVGEVYFCGGLSRGAIGIALSHLSIIKDAYDSGYEMIWIFEDDIQVLKDPKILIGLIDELNQIVGHDGWDIFFTDRDIRDAKNQYTPAAGYARRPNYQPKDRLRVRMNKEISPNLRKIGARFGCHSMILQRSALEKLLNFYKKYQLYHPIDMDMHAPEGMRMFTVLDDVITNMPGWISDNGHPFYKEKTNSLR